MTEKTPQLTEIELKYRFWGQLVELGRSVGTTLIKVVGYVSIAYFLNGSIEAYSRIQGVQGINVSVSIEKANLFPIEFFKSPPIWVGLAGCFFGVCGILFGWNRQRLLMEKTEKLQSRNIELEKKNDPNRSSSNLTPRGETRKEDL